MANLCKDWPFCFMENLKKRAKRKYINNPFISKLVTSGSPMAATFATTFGCSSVINIEDGKAKSSYCKQRWCTVCGSIRTAVRINSFMPIIEGLKISLDREIFFTTLTVPNVSETNLLPTIKKFQLALRQFSDQMRKNGQKLYCVYNIETTINFKTGLYHPHIHILHLDALTLLSHWKKTFPKISNDAQLPNKETFDVLEIFKYNSKPFTGLNLKELTSGKYNFDLNQIIRKYATLYEIIKGSRLFGAYGFKLPKIINEEKIMDELTATIETEFQTQLFKWALHDWINEDGETLANFIPDKKQINYVAKFDSK